MGRIDMYNMKYGQEQRKPTQSDVKKVKDLLCDFGIKAGALQFETLSELLRYKRDTMNSVLNR